jgi:PAS domain S-box-containing protein
VQLNKINRVYALISQINNLIIRTHSQKELFQEICNIAVNFGKFRMSWIGLINENHIIITEAVAGYEMGYFTESNITTNLDKPEGRGPTGIATREERTVICNDVANDEMMKPWRKDALERGYNSLISIPIIVRNKTIGAFNLYSSETNFFSSEEEILLLEKIILNISFALETIQIEEDRKRTEEKIRQLSQAVEQSPVTIVITNKKGEIEYVNPKFVETTGYTIDEVIGQNPRILKSGYTSYDEYKELWQTVRAGKEWHGEFHNKRKDGTLFWESATISPILNTQGKSTHFIAIKEDITNRKIAEQDLINAKLQAEESDRLKLVFLANMSHEIRTPMNGILGFTELLKAPHLTGEEQQEYISIIEKSGKRMLNIINDIISISKVESGQIEISLSETDINEQINYIHSFFKPEANQKGIQLLITKELPSTYNLIKTDREKLYAILTNLVKNAIKFTNEGTIKFGCEKKDGNLEFFVKDSGIGISNSQKNIIFERFRQANESISRSHEGSGLGLAISKAYIDMLGGKIWVDSEEGKGSTFYFTIPFILESKSEEKIVVEKVDIALHPENKIKELKVLIVEDDAISKLLITIAIKPYSKEVLKVSTGIEAVAACRNNPDIDLVMMDINMPKMGGYEATKQIREFNKDLIIIAQTANGMQSDREQAIAAGCTDYISKPINIQDLNALVQRYFKK